MSTSFLAHTTKILISFLSLALLVLGFEASAFANSEKKPVLPKSFLALSKNSKELYVLENENSFEVKKVYASIYGEAEGDKLVEGDLKTPEGVYFVTHKIPYALDFLEYGTGAYGLNYPNPVDRMKQKTGGGIWVHSKGEPISGQATRGCVAVDLDDFADVAQFLPNGTAVVLSDSFSPDKVNPNTSDATANALIQRTQEWNKAWASRSNTFFDFYDEQKYTLAQRQSFRAFRAQKESLFSRLAWIEILHGDVYVLEGTDYWVTYFDQLYSAPNLSSEGIRRLYWQQDANGEFKVVGMEWQQKRIGLRQQMLAKEEEQVRELLEEWRQSWLVADVSKYASYYDNNAKQGKLVGDAIFKQKESIWTNNKPQVIEFSNIQTKHKGNVIQVSFRQDYSDSNGYKDRGIKTMSFIKVDNTWKIFKEDWRAI